jgi:hypothetical protein
VLFASVLVAGGVSVAATSCLGDNPADLLGDTYLMPTTTVPEPPSRRPSLSGLRTY